MALRRLLVVAAVALPCITSTTMTAVDALVTDIAEGRAKGCFVTRGENVPDVTAMAVPVAVNHELYGLAVAGPSHRMIEREAEIRAALAATRDGLLDQGLAGTC